MNFLGATFRSLAVVMVVFVSNISAVNCPTLIPTVIVAGSYLNEKKAAELFGEKYISGRKQVVIGKAVLGSVANAIPVIYTHNDYDKQDLFSSRVKNLFVGYIAVNAALRVGCDYVGLDQEYIDKRCDEILPENVAKVAKIVAPVLLDLAYNYITVDIIKSIGIAKRS